MRTQVRSMLFVLALTTSLALLGACSKKEPAPDTAPQETQVADHEAEAVAPQEKPVKKIDATPTPLPTPQPKVVEATPTKKNKPDLTTLLQTPGVTVTKTQMDPATSVEYMVFDGWNKIRSISAKMTSSYKQLGGDGKRQHTGDGVSDYVRDGVSIRTVHRLGTLMTHHTGADPPIILTGQKLSRYSDGKYMYTITERQRGTVVTKRFANHRQIKYLGGERLFAFIRGLKNLREIPGESIDGKFTFILEGELPRYHLKYRHYIDEETGILLKMVVENSAKQSTSVTEFTDIEINIEFTKGHFDFNPPDGVEVQDLTIPGSKLKPPTPREPQAAVEEQP